MILRLANSQIRQRAFTLVEVMVGVMVVAILFVTLFVGLAQGFSLSSAARERLRANQIILERIEGIRLVKWDDLTNTALVPLTFTAQYAPGSAQSGVVYNGTVKLEIPNMGALPPSYASAMRQITVDVTWTSGQRSFNHNASTMVSRHGMQNYIYEN
jgi:prepilin-type N-terminal cleavage/methylation domain-containing protein